MSKTTIKQIPSYSSFRAKRLIQIFWAVEVAYLLGFIQCIITERYGLAAKICGIIIAVSYVLKLVKDDKLNVASTYLLSVLTLIITLFMWLYGGIFDEIVYAFPCVLIFASMLGDRKLFISITCFIFVSILLNGYFNQQGWYLNEPEVITLDSATLICIIIGVVAYTIWILSSDFKKLLVTLHNENKQVKKSKDEIEKLIHHDLLTGLPNREMAEMCFSNNLKDPHKKTTALMFIDLDNFKSLNDALGHQAGDQILKAFTKRLLKILPASYTVGRFAGDEFIVMLDNTSKQEDIIRVAQEIMQSLNLPFVYESNEFTAHCSIGISLVPEHGNDFKTLVRNADTAMYYSKSTGGNSYHVFNTEMDNQGHEYLTTVIELRKAIAEQRLILHYQPKVDFKTNKIIGAEALVRWLHPTKGVVSPIDFIPQAEKSGLIVEIGEWVLNEACNACKEWHKLGFTELEIAVNVSAKQFQRTDISELVKTTLAKHSLNAKYLELELTESLLFDGTGLLKQKLIELRNLGIILSIDDFGTGYSNLAYLKEFQIETLKIDQSFIREIKTNENNKAIVVAIIQIAKSLGLKTVAEGVEDEETAAIVKELQCDYGQGYLWSKPVSKEEMVTLLHA